MKTLKNVSTPIPLSSDEESPSESNSDDQESPIATDAEADSPCNTEDESPAGTSDRLILQTRREVTNESNVNVCLSTTEAEVPSKNHPNWLPERAMTSEQ